MRMLKTSLFALLTLVALPAAATTLDLNFNDHAFRLHGAVPLNPVAVGTNAELNGSFIHSDLRSGDTLDIGNVGLMATGSFGLPGTRAGLGIKGFYADRTDFSGGGAALAAQLSWHPPAFNRFGVFGYVNYGPGVLVGGDFNHYFEYAINAEYQIIRSASVYAGYRHLSLPLDRYVPGRPGRADEGWLLGIRVHF
jgi:YfaZ precursor.